MYMNTLMAKGIKGHIKISYADSRQQLFSSKQLKRHKRESTDYKIEMFFLIDYSIYN